MLNNYYVYIITNGSKTLYIGVTSNLAQRVYQHKEKLTPGFASRNNIDKLVYFEVTNGIEAAIAREKQLKGFNRLKKLRLVESVNPGWQELASR